jgi:ribokinase
MNGMSSAAPDKPARHGVVVLGSLNVDLVVTVSQIPRPGETVLGGAVSRLPGGKGANQAVSAARLGGDVRLIGRIGSDDFGDAIRLRLGSAGVDHHHVRMLRDVASGIAFVSVDRDGENAIVVSPGANARLTPDELELDEAAVKDAQVAVAQLETPMGTVERFAELCEVHGADLILNAAPYHDLSAGLLRRCKYLILNRDEATSLSNIIVKERKDAFRALAEIARRGGQNIIITLGGDGSVALTEANYIELDAYRVPVVDTTGAGDAFVGAFAVALSRQDSFDDALKFAAAAGAVACAHVGAQQSETNRREIQVLLNQQPQVPRRGPALEPSPR